MKNRKKAVGIICLLCMVLALTVCAYAEEPVEKQESSFWSADVADSLEQVKFNEGSSSNYTKYAKTPDGEEKPSVELEIKIAKENSLKFRKDLVSDKIDLKEYSEGKLEKVPLGGRDFYVVRSESFGKKKAVYYGRDIPSQMTLRVTVTGDQEDADVSALLDSLQFSLPEGNGEEAPYPWDGEPLVTKTGSVEVNGHTITATQIIGDESLLAPSVFDNRVVVDGKYVYLLSQQLLYVYEMDGDRMTIQEKYEMDQPYASLAKDDNGTVYLTAFGKPVRVYREGKFVEELSFKGEMIPSPDGSFLLSFFTKAKDMKKVDPADGKETEFVITGDPALDGVTDVCFDSGCIFMNSYTDSKTRLHVADMDGNYIITLSDEEGDSLGSITMAAVYDDMYWAIDANMREIIFWDKDGKWLEGFDDKDLFGTSYPWISGLWRTDEHTFYVSLCEERPDKSWDEVAVYRVTME